MTTAKAMFSRGSGRIFSWLLVVGVVACTPCQAAAPDFAQVIEQLAQSERKLQNLTVEAEVREEHRAKASDQWERTPVMVHVAAYFNGQSGGPARIDVKKQVSVWEGGQAPYGEASYVVSFDGENSRWIELSGGPVGKTGGSSSAQILPGRHPLLAGFSYATGTQFSAPLYREAEGKTLSQYLRDYANKLGSIEGSHRTVESDVLLNVPCIKVSLGRKGMDETWWLDPARGLQPIGYQKRTGPGMHVVQEFRVTALKEASPGVWYPEEAYLEWNHLGESPVPVAAWDFDRRLHYRASQIKANDAQFDPAIFKAAIPGGYSVDDQVGPTTRAAPATRTAPTTRAAPRTRD